jgi:hypothetical protein
MKGAEEVERQKQDRFNMILLLIGVVLVMAFIYASPFFATPHNPGLAKLLFKLQTLSGKLFFLPYSQHSLLFDVLFLLLPILLWTFFILRPPNWESKFAEQAAFWTTLAAPMAALSQNFILDSRPFFATPLQHWALRLTCFAEASLIASLAPFAALKRGPQTVRDLSATPDAFDLEDLGAPGTIASRSNGAR